MKCCKGINWFNFIFVLKCIKILYYFVYIDVWDEKLFKMYLFGSKEEVGFLYVVSVGILFFFAILKLS